VSLNWKFGKTTEEKENFAKYDHQPLSAFTVTPTPTSVIPTPTSVPVVVNKSGIVEKHEDRGLVLELPSGVLFSSGKAALKAEAQPILDEAANILMNMYPQAHILIEGHTDNIPIKNSKKFADNNALSAARAEVVQQYFVDKGIEAGRMDAKGFGGSKPKVSNDTAENRSKNRRVELVVQKTVQ